MQKFKSHMKSFEVPVIEKHVHSASKENDFFKIKLSDEEVKARYILIATGTKEKLGVPGEAGLWKRCELLRYL